MDKNQISVNMSLFYRTLTLKSSDLDAQIKMNKDTFYLLNVLDKRSIDEKVWKYSAVRVLTSKQMGRRQTDRRADQHYRVHYVPASPLIINYLII